MPVVGLKPPSDAVSMSVDCENKSGISCSSISNFVVFSRRDMSDVILLVMFIGVVLLVFLIIPGGGSPVIQFSCVSPVKSIGIA